MKRLCAALLAIALGLTAAAARGGDVADSPHNLSVSGPGLVRSASEREVCVFCHAPHNSSPQAPLWNRADPGGTYATYASSTLRSLPGQPNGASRLCLSCHDGTIALGRVVSRAVEIPMAGSSNLPPGASRLGTDISDDHPVSFGYAASLAGHGGRFVPAPADGGRSLLDTEGRVQCTSCHDPHDNGRGAFLRLDPRGGRLCRSCHVVPGWADTPHGSSGSVWNLAGEDPWPGSSHRNVADNACGNCHTPHHAAGRARLLLRGTEEGNCLPCHGGNVASMDIATEIAKWTRHDVRATTGIHDRAEVPDGRRTHVECVDCHEPHACNSDPAVGGGVPGALRGVSGLSASGTPVPAAASEHEVCFKCHADPTDSRPGRIPRVLPQPDLRRLFAAQNPSYHPVGTAGRNPDVPSLRPPWTTASVIRCTDCHANDAGPGAGGSGPKGPHGSRHDFLLERNHTTSDPATESATAYALCYKCHDRTSILSDRSFRGHREHVVEERTPCSVCHAPHGIDAAQGGAANHSNLVNFDTRVVSRNARGERTFTDTGTFRGTCSLRCHGHDHDGESY